MGSDLSEQDPNAALNRDEWLALMLEREASTRADKRFANRLRTAKLRFPNACIEDIDFTAPRGLDRRKLLALAQGGWLKALLVVCRQTTARQCMRTLS